MTDDRTAGERDVISEPFRRHVCEYLSSNDDLVVTLEELTRAIADTERVANDTPVADTDDGWIATSLHHVHLPKLDDAGVVTYDHDRRTVQADEGLPAVLELLGALEASSSDADFQA